MNTSTNSEQGHWILAKMGKKVLRPGGKKLTKKLVNELNIENNDDVVEFAPGVGYTASFILKKYPLSYTGIELSKEAADGLKSIVYGRTRKIINTSAANTGLENESTDKIVGEAMLTMQADHRKSEIIKEAYRILKKGGCYGIHELGLTPNNIDSSVKDTIQRELAQTIQVNARPLTESEWCDLLVKEGFKIKKTYHSPMHLLKVKRIISDEGIFRTLKIGFNVLTHTAARKRIFKMRSVFKKYEKQMISFAIIAEK